MNTKQLPRIFILGKFSFAQWAKRIEKGTAFPVYHGDEQPHLITDIADENHSFGVLHSDNINYLLGLAKEDDLKMRVVSHDTLFDDLKSEKELHDFIDAVQWYGAAVDTAIEEVDDGISEGDLGGVMSDGTTYYEDVAAMKLYRAQLARLSSDLQDLCDYIHDTAFDDVCKECRAKEAK